VVGVDVDICHTLHAAVEQFLDSQGGVVVDAEAAGPFPGRVVHSAAEVNGPDGAAIQDRELAAAAAATERDFLGHRSAAVQRARDHLRTNIETRYHPPDNAASKKR